MTFIHTYHFVFASVYSQKCIKYFIVIFCVIKNDLYLEYNKNLQPNKISIFFKYFTLNSLTDNFNSCLFMFAFNLNNNNKNNNNHHHLRFCLLLKFFEFFIVFFSIFFLFFFKFYTDHHYTHTYKDHSSIHHPYTYIDNSIQSSNLQRSFLSLALNTLNEKAR